MASILTASVLAQQRRPLGGPLLLLASGLAVLLWPRCWAKPMGFALLSGDGGRLRC